MVLPLPTCFAVGFPYETPDPGRDRPDLGYPLSFGRLLGELAAHCTDRIRFAARVPTLCSTARLPGRTTRPPGGRTPCRRVALVGAVLNGHHYAFEGHGMEHVRLSNPVGNEPAHEDAMSSRVLPSSRRLMDRSEL